MGFPFASLLATLAMPVCREETPLVAQQSLIGLHFELFEPVDLCFGFCEQLSIM